MFQCDLISIMGCKTLIGQLFSLAKEFWGVFFQMATLTIQVAFFEERGDFCCISLTPEVSLVMLLLVSCICPYSIFDIGVLIS